MDFIDEFIEEYKNNPCLWKTDSINFKNRTKRQEAYFQLIKVAQKHGENYNVERTKQKINNLRCAFRHQLKKYFEFKEKGEKDEPYCPKRKYFESLMFLRDEENLDKKQTREKLNNKNSIQAITIVNPSVSGSNANQNEINKSVPEVEEINIDKNLNSFIIPNNGDPVKIIDCEKLNDFVPAAPDFVPTMELKKLDSKIDTNEDIVNAQKGQQRERKRSSSLPTQLLNDGDLFSGKHLKIDFTGIDFKNLLSLACKNIDSTLDDNFTNFGKIIAHKLRTMQPLQALYAEKIIGDVIYQGQMKLLSSSKVDYFVSLNTESM